MKFTFKVLISATLIVFVRAQFGDGIFEIFDLGQFTSQSRPNSNQVTQRYQENERLSSSDLQNCNSFWSIRNDNFGAYGELRIPTQDRTQINLRAVLSLGARLPSVRKLLLSLKRVSSS